MGHKIDPNEADCSKFRGLYLSDTIGENFPADAFEMTVMLFKANTKSVDLPVRFSELVYFLVEMVGSEEFDLLYGLEVFRTDKNMSCRVHAAESVLDRLFKQIRAHHFFTESFKGTTMMLADKKPVSIKLIPKTGQDLWCLDVGHSEEYTRFGINSTATIAPSMNCLIAFYDFPFNGVRLYHKDTAELLPELPQMVYTVSLKYLMAFIDIPIQKRLHPGELYEIHLNFGLNHIIGIEIVKSEQEGRVDIKYFLDNSVTENDVKQIDYFIRTLPIYSSFVSREYDFKLPFAKAGMRTSVTGPIMNVLPTQGESFMKPCQYYEEGKLPKKIKDATFIFEFKVRDLGSAKKACALVYTGPNDAFTKAAVLHSTYYNFLVKHHLVQDLIYRIVLRPADNGKSMQYIWILSTPASKELKNVAMIVLKEMMVFLWMSLGGKPERVEMQTIHPRTLKVLKGENFELFSPENVDLYMRNPIEEIEIITLNMPFANKFCRSPTAEPEMPALLPKNVSIQNSGEEPKIIPEPLPEQQSASESAITPPTATSLTPLSMAVVEPKTTLACQLSSAASFLMNGEFAASRLIVLITGLPRPNSVTLSETVSFLRASNYAEHIGRVTVNPVGSIEITLSDSLTFIELTQLKALFLSVFKGKISIRTRAKRS